MITIKITIFYESPYWVGSFERQGQEGFAMARHIFGAEPSDTEIHEFVLTNYAELKFGKPREFKLIIKRMNPKRLQREVKKEMEKLKKTERPSTYAQSYMKEEQEKNKIERKQKAKDHKKNREEKQFSIKQIKKKEKHKGH
ncbi:MAG: putative protein YjdF [Chlamydiae bacterium]|nr:putative protein YjdF [Chlamydiota bacterium]